MPLTNSLNLPLKQTPYRSRVSSNYTDKNYFMLAFNPGYALQAAELNEIQELFFLNQTLSLSYPNLWLTRGYQRTGYWEGVVPYDPNKITCTITNISGINYTFSLTIQEGWYLWTDKTSNLSLWIYNPTTYTNSEYTTTLVSNAEVEYIGFFIRSNIVNCCQSGTCPPDQDPTLRDNASGSSLEFTCGSSRLGLEFYNETNPTTSLAIPSLRNDPNAVENFSGKQFNFYPLLRLEALTSTNTSRIKFYDSQPVIITT